MNVVWLQEGPQWLISLIDADIIVKIIESIYGNFLFSTNLTGNKST